MTSYFVGDIPATQLVIQLDEPDIDVSAYTGVTGKLLQASSDALYVADLTGVTFTLDHTAETVTVNWGTTSHFTARGLWTLALTLTGTGGVKQTVGTHQIVVEEENGWHTLRSIRNEWTGANQVEDAALFTLLDAAHTAIIQYGPNTIAGNIITPNLREAQKVQARDIWNATKSDPAGQIDAGGFAITVFPMSWHVKSLVRPKTWPPVVR